MPRPSIESRLKFRATMESALSSPSPRHPNVDEVEKHVYA